MKAVASALRARATSAGALLRQWRDIRGKTQLDLSFDAGVSQKHISFVESGRSMHSYTGGQSLSGSAVLRDFRIEVSALFRAPAWWK